MSKILRFEFLMLAALLATLTLGACSATAGNSAPMKAVTAEVEGTAEVKTAIESTPVTGHVGELDPNTLLDLMLYHMVATVHTGLELAADDSVVTMSADSIAVTDPNSIITLNSDVQVVEEDIEACNGVLHIIDYMLTKPDLTGNDATAPPEEPTTAAAATGQTTPVPTLTPCEEGQTIADILRSRPDLSRFAKAVESVGLMDMLDQDGTYTVFAPPDGGFVLPTTVPDADSTATSNGSG